MFRVSKKRVNSMLDFRSLRRHSKDITLKESLNILQSNRLPLQANLKCTQNIILNRFWIQILINSQHNKDVRL